MEDIAPQRLVPQRLDPPDTIAQAKGMLMERFDVDAAAAFELLVSLSQKSNTPQAVIAQKLVEIDHPSTSSGTPGTLYRPPQ